MTEKQAVGKDWQKALDTRLAQRVMKTSLSGGHNLVLPYVFWLHTKKTGYTVLWVGITDKKPDAPATNPLVRDYQKWFKEVTFNGLREDDTVSIGEGLFFPRNNTGPAPAEGILASTSIGKFWLHTVVPQRLAEECRFRK